MKHMQVWNIIQFSYQSFKSPLSASLFTHVSLKIYLGWHTALTFRDIACICCGKVSESLIDLTAQTLRTFYFYSFLQSFCWDLCQHYYVATATAHNFVCSLSVGRDDSHDWLHAHQRPMLCFDSAEWFMAAKQCKNLKMHLRHWPKQVHMSDYRLLTQYSPYHLHLHM